MGLVGFFTVRRRAAQLLSLGRRFRRDRTSSAAVEFALVGGVYFFLLFVAIEGGVFYLLTTTLDYATESASRTIMINQGANNAGTFTAAPTTPAALETLIQTDSYGVLNLLNITAAVQMAPPVTGTVIAAGTGFKSITLPIAAGTYTYLPGSCTVDYYTVSVNGGTPAYTLETNHGCTAGTCSATAAKFALLPADGEVEGGTSVSSTAGTTVTTAYTGATFSCSGGQDVVVQAQYTDSLLAQLVSYLFGPITSTIAFQVEPPTT